MERFDVVVIGAGAAGMMCAIEAGKRGRRVLVLEHAKAAGEKIRISGGGRCNFTNIRTEPHAFLSQNPRFCRSALDRFRPQDILALIDAHKIAWHEKTLGQLFCDGSARQIVDLLLGEMSAHGVTLKLGSAVQTVAKTSDGFHLTLAGAAVACQSLVIATGGKSIPKMGATGFGFDLAAQFGIPVVPPLPGLVPLTLEPELLERLKPLAGMSLNVRVCCGQAAFEEAMLFTHRGLSGPAILQISSYWRAGEVIEIDLCPGVDAFQVLRQARSETPRQSVATVLARMLPQRLAQRIAETEAVSGNIADASDKTLRRLAETLRAWRIRPAGTEGYRTAEVTLGGVAGDALDQRTMQAKAVQGLYFIGEVVDVTGWLGGYNLQWAWASGWCAGQAV